MSSKRTCLCHGPAHGGVDWSLVTAMNELFEAEGWALFHPADAGRPLLEIQRLDDTKMFPGDEAAARFVHAMAEQGSHRHQIALDLLRRAKALYKPTNAHEQR